MCARVENLFATSAETGYGKAEVLAKIRWVIDRANAPAIVDEDENEDGEDETQA